MITCLIRGSLNAPCPDCAQEYRECYKMIVRGETFSNRVRLVYLPGSIALSALLLALLIGVSGFEISAFERLLLKLRAEAVFGLAFLLGLNHLLAAEKWRLI